MKNGFGVREWVSVAAIVAVLLLTGVIVLASPFGPIQARDIRTDYGKRTGPAMRSVNGTSVFAGMFGQRCRSISTWSRLSPRLKRSDVIVWVPNSFELPEKEAIDYLENDWLARDDNRFRTLIFVARDFDAGIDYWQQQADSAKGQSYLESRSQLARMQSDHALQRAYTAVAMKSDWFTIESNQSFTDVKADRGEWFAELQKNLRQLNSETNSSSVTKSELTFPAAGVMDWPEPKNRSGRKYEVLLGSEETPLIVKLTDDFAWPDGQVILLLNGSSVLNLPLVQTQNRLIASKLMDECGNSVRRVTFLETGPAGIEVSRRDPKAYSGFDALKIWPINSILLHLIVAGILYCAMVFPIFGRPRELDGETTSNFGKHVRAMADLLVVTQDRNAAIAKVQQYRNLKIDSLVIEPGEAKPEAGNPFQISKL